MRVPSKSYKSHNLATASDGDVKLENKYTPTLIYLRVVCVKPHVDNLHVDLLLGSIEDCIFYIITLFNHLPILCLCLNDNAIWANF